jgi:hypothetical protein
MIDGDTSVAVVFVRNVAVAALFGFAGLVWAVLAGAVLQRIIRMLPVRAWIVMNTAVSAATGVLLLPSGSASADVTSLQDLSLGAVVMGGVLLGAILGGVSGGFQVLVLRRAATGMGAWMLWSSISGAGCFAVSALVAMLLPPEIGLFNLLAGQVVSALAAVLGAAVMVPAVYRLSPRVP